MIKLNKVVDWEPSPIEGGGQNTFCAEVKHRCFSGCFGNKPIYQNRIPHNNLLYKIWGKTRNLVFLDLVILNKIS